MTEVAGLAVMLVFCFWDMIFFSSLKGRYHLHRIFYRLDANIDTSKNQHIKA
jgi:hypothetical protein